MLYRKMIRDIKSNFLAYFACVLIISIGLSTYISMSNTMDTLKNSKDEFYNNYRFADIFAEVESFPISKLKELEKIEGISSADGKLVYDARVLFSDTEQNVYLRLISIDLDNENRLNDIWYIKGNKLDKKSKGILTGIKFYDLNNLYEGQTISVVVKGKKIDLEILGAAQSPEFVYVVKDQASFFNDSKSFDVAYISKDVLENMINSKGFVNNISFTLEPGYTYDDVKENIKTALNNYILKSLLEQEDQISNFMLNNEMNQLDQTAKSMPVLFLTISTIILWIMLKRLVENQRTQIGMLKAQGYSKSTILWHYIQYSIIIGVAGAILGSFLGDMIYDYMVVMYNDFFTLPKLDSVFSYKYLFESLFLAIFFSILAGYLGARKVLKYSPSEAMQPEAPQAGKKVFIENIKIFWSMLNVQGRMAVRNIFRKKGRSLFTLIGISTAFSLMACLFSMIDLFDVLIFDQFKYVQKYDVKVALYSPVNSVNSIYDISHIKGVEYTEPLFELPVILRNSHLEESTIILGISDDSLLYNVVDSKNKRVDIGKEDFILSETLAKNLNIKKGDILEVENPLTNKKFNVVVTNIIPQYIGNNGYTNIDYLSNLTGLKNTCTSVIMNVDQKEIKSIKEKLNKSKLVGNIEENTQLKNQYEELLDQFFFMFYILGALAVITGFAIIYNSAIVSYSERKRELASLRVMGMHPKEVMEVLSFEQAFLLIFGIILGIPMSYSYLLSMGESFNTDLYTIPVRISSSSFVLAFVGTLLSLIIAILSLRKRIINLDMVEVLKQRE